MEQFCGGKQVNTGPQVLAWYWSYECNIILGCIMARELIMFMWLLTWTVNEVEGWVQWLDDVDGPSCKYVIGSCEMSVYIWIVRRRRSMQGSHQLYSLFHY